MSDEDQRTIYCCNLSERVDEEIIYELFLQAGPIERVNMPKDQRGESRGIAFIEYSHKVSVPYALQLFVGTKLYNRALNMRSRNNTNPVQLTPQYIEANNPLTAPRHPGGYQNSHMHPGRARPRQEPSAGNPFEQFTDPALLMALTNNFHGQGGPAAAAMYQEMGKYDQQRDPRDEGYKHNRHHHHRNHDQYNPYDDRREGGGGGNRHRDRDRDRDRNWTNGGRNNGGGGGGGSRRRF